MSDFGRALPFLCISYQESSVQCCPFRRLSLLSFVITSQLVIIGQTWSCHVRFSQCSSGFSPSIANVGQTNCRMAPGIQLHFCHWLWRERSIRAGSKQDRIESSCCLLLLMYCFNGCILFLVLTVSVCFLFCHQWSEANRGLTCCLFTQTNNYLNVTTETSYYLCVFVLMTSRV